MFKSVAAAHVLCIEDMINNDPNLSTGGKWDSASPTSFFQKNQLQEMATGLLPLRFAGMPHKRPTNPTSSWKKSRQGNKSRMTATGTGVSLEGVAHHSDAREERRTHSKRKVEFVASVYLHGHTSTQQHSPPSKKQKKKRRTAD